MNLWLTCSRQIMEIKKQEKRKGLQTGVTNGNQRSHFIGIYQEFWEPDRWELKTLCACSCIHLLNSSTWTQFVDCRFLWCCRWFIYRHLCPTEETSGTSYVHSLQFSEFSTRPNSHKQNFMRLILCCAFWQKWILCWSQTHKASQAESRYKNFRLSTYP